LSDPLNARALFALAHRPLQLAELREELEAPAQTTLRLHLRRLSDLGVVTRREHSGFPGTVDYGMGPAGNDLLRTAEVLSAWLATSPDGPLMIADPAAGDAVKALVGGWTSNILRVLAARPLTLTQLDRLIPAINYPALERRIAAMRRVGQLAPAQVGANGKPYKVTRWLRQAVSPLAVAAAWEIEWAHGQAGRLHRNDVVATLLLVLPLLELHTDTSGTCGLLVDIGEVGADAIGGVAITIDRGRIVSIGSDLEVADGWALASGLGWLGIFGGKSDSTVSFGGNRALADAVVASLSKSVNPEPGRTNSSEQNVKSKAPKSMSKKSS
jgi:DNA-binding HxlR family transcriptional regulator